MENDDKQGRLQNGCQYVVTIELDTLAVLAKQAMSAKTRSKFSLSFKDREAKQVSILTRGQGGADGRAVRDLALKIFCQRTTDVIDIMPSPLPKKPTQCFLANAPLDPCKLENGRFGHMGN